MPIDKETQQLRWVWDQMVRRCHDAKNRGYAAYGAKGLTVCDSWRHSFQEFVKDMGKREPGMSIDRINNSLGYSPENCRWADRVTQNSNRGYCIYVEIAGEKLTLKEACRRLGLKYRPIHKRVQARGWSIERALSTPIGKGNSRCL